MDEASGDEVSARKKAPPQQEALPLGAATQVSDLTRLIVAELGKLELSERIGALNEIRRALHEASPFHDEPVDFVEWVPLDHVVANTWNPNRTAPPEQKLLEHSIVSDGYTQPIVTFLEDESKHEVVDGYHRNRVAKESADVRKRVLGHLPIVHIQPSRSGKSDRIASTIRHNRARGVHAVDGMSEIVRMLYQAGWRDEKIREELGMDADEVRRLKQITGLAELFASREFSEAWEPET